MILSEIPPIRNNEVVIIHKKSPNIKTIEFELHKQQDPAFRESPPTDPQQPGNEFVFVCALYILSVVLIFFTCYHFNEQP